MRPSLLPLSRFAALDIRAGVVLAASAIALAPIAVFAPNGTVVLVVLAAVTLALDPAHRRAALALVSTEEARLLMALIALAALSSLWSFDPLRGLLLSLRLAVLMAAGGILLAAAAALRPDDAHVARRGMAAGGILLVGLLLIETGSGLALTQFIRGLDAVAAQQLGRSAPLSRAGTILALFIWPALVVVPLWYGRWSWLPVLAAAVIAAMLWQPPTDAVLVAGLVGLAVFVAVTVAPAAARRLGPPLVLVLLLLPPLAAVLLPAIYDQADLAAMPQSYRHRVQIWTFALERIAERPLLGWGFDSSRELMGTGAGAVFAEAPMSLHTHNVTLQSWMELGLGGVVIVAALGFRLARRAAALPPRAAAAALAGLAAALVFAEISRGAWQHWWLAAFWLFAAWIAALARPVRA